MCTNLTFDRLKIIETLNKLNQPIRKPKFFVTHSIDCDRLVCGVSTKTTKFIMHIILLILGTIVTILILVNRLSALIRKYRWEKRRDSNPVYSLTDPMEVTALLMVALAKSEGEISVDQKREIINKFKELFHMDEDKASALLTSSIFILKEDISVVKNMSKILEPSIKSFSEEQASSALSLLTHISNFDSPANNFQLEIIGLFEDCFRGRFSTSNEWS